MSNRINKEWMNERNRISQVYLQGVDDFIAFAIANDVQKLSTILCPCVKRQNKMCFSPTDVRKHLITKGIKRTYTKWLLHGEKPLTSCIKHPSVGNVELVDNPKEDNIGNSGLGMGTLLTNLIECMKTMRGGQTRVFAEADISNEKQDKTVLESAKPSYVSTTNLL